MSPQMKSLQDVRNLADAELSLKARLGYVALLLVSLAVTAVIASLWLTEHALPVHTQWSFGALCLIGLSWIALSIWALGARRPLFARDRVIAGGMAVVFSTMFVTGTIAAVILAGNAASYAALATGAVMLAAALKVWSGARRRFAMLMARRAELAS